MTEGLLPFDDDDALAQLLEDRMRIYLAGALTGLPPAQADQCRDIRVRAKRVLRTRFTVYDPAEITPPGTEHTADDVFNEDHTRTSTADVVLFHVNAPSLGVGIESQIAAEATVPRIIAVPKGMKVSRMFDGVFNPTIVRIEYESAEDFEEQLLEQLPRIVDAAKKSAAKRRPIMASIGSATIGRDIFQSRVLLKMDLDSLAAATDIRTCLLKRLERDDRVAATLTLAQLSRIAHELKATLAVSGGQVPTLQGPVSEPEVRDHHKQSLDSLYQWLRERAERWVPDQQVFRMWEYAFPLGLNVADAARGEDAALKESALSVKDWHEIDHVLNDDDGGPTLFR